MLQYVSFVFSEDCISHLNKIRRRGSNKYRVSAVVLENSIIVLSISACERLETTEMGVQAKLSFPRNALVVIVNGI